MDFERLDFTVGCHRRRLAPGDKISLTNLMYTAHTATVQVEDINFRPQGTAVILQLINRSPYTKLGETGKELRCWGWVGVGITERVMLYFPSA